MNLIDWILKNRPGTILEVEDRVEIEHDSGEHSTLWVGDGTMADVDLAGLGTLYRDFDGMDLFSSTFKVASAQQPKGKHGVCLVFSLSQLLTEVDAIGCEFPQNSTPFLYQAGIGYCAVQKASSRIFECDLETGGHVDSYDSLEDLLDDWLVAVS